MKGRRPGMGKMGKAGGASRGLRKGPRRHRPRRFGLRHPNRVPTPGKVIFERSKGCSMILVGVIIITSLYILV